MHNLHGAQLRIPHVPVSRSIVTREREDHKTLETSSNATDSCVKGESSLEMSSDTDSQTPSLVP